MSEMKIMHKQSPNLLANHTLVQKCNSNDSSADSRALDSVRLFLNHDVCNGNKIYDSFQSGERTYSM